MLESFTPTFFRRLQQLKIRTRRAFLGSRQGGHLSKRRGHGLEFADYRIYTPGDDFRHIDWNVYGRQDRLYVRQFREEQDLNVSFLIDSSQSMGFGQEQSKYDMACRLALALGYVALTDGDTVTFTLLGQENSPRYMGARALTRAAAYLSKSKPTGSFDPVLETGAAIQRLKTPGKCFVLSDFMFDLETQFAMLDLLRARNFEVALLHVLSPEEISPTFSGAASQLEDSETNEILDINLDPSSRKEYAKLLADHIESLERYALKCGIAHLLVSSNEDVSDVVLSRLPQLGLLK
jgi:uncharacterized protein (DUF58 family)